MPFRQQPGILDEAVVRTFENVREVLGVHEIMRFASTEMTEDASDFYRDVMKTVPTSWKQAGQARVDVWLSNNALTFDLHLIGWANGAAVPVEIASALAELTASNTNLKKHSIEFTPVNLSTYDLVGVRIDNTSLGTSAEFRLWSGEVEFRTRGYNPDFEV